MYLAKSKVFVHQHLWQRVPRAWRRAALFRATVLAAPPADALDAAPSFPIIVAGALRTASGLGELARLCVAALRAAGLPVQGLDIGPALMQPEDNIECQIGDADIRGRARHHSSLCQLSAGTARDAPPWQTPNQRQACCRLLGVGASQTTGRLAPRRGVRTRDLDAKPICRTGGGQHCRRPARACRAIPSGDQTAKADAPGAWRNAPLHCAHHLQHGLELRPRTRSQPSTHFAARLQMILRRGSSSRHPTFQRFLMDLIC